MGWQCLTQCGFRQHIIHWLTFGSHELVTVWKPLPQKHGMLFYAQSVIVDPLPCLMRCWMQAAVMAVWVVQVDSSWSRERNGLSCGHQHE